MIYVWLTRMYVDETDMYCEGIHFPSPFSHTHIGPTGTNSLCAPMTHTTYVIITAQPVHTSAYSNTSDNNNSYMDSRLDLQFLYTHDSLARYDHIHTRTTHRVIHPIEFQSQCSCRTNKDQRALCPHGFATHTDQTGKNVVFFDFFFDSFCTFFDLFCLCVFFDLF